MTSPSSKNLKAFPYSPGNQLGGTEPLICIEQKWGDAETGSLTLKTSSTSYSPSSSISSDSSWPAGDSATPAISSAILLAAFVSVTTKKKKKIHLIL